MATREISAEELNQMKDWFDKVDTDKSGRIDLAELHQGLLLGGNSFDLDITKRLYAVFDTDASGELGKLIFYRTDLWLICY